MKVTFWGTRGSIPAVLSAAAVRDKIAIALIRAAGRDLGSSEAARAFVERELSFPEGATYGGNSSCVQVETAGPDYLICDMGSGARELAVQALARHGPGAPQTYHVLMSHLHWDHIMGFPFFTPVYIPGNRIRIYGCHRELEQAYRAQHCAPSFPIDFAALRASIEFVVLEPDRPTEIAGFRVTPTLQNHGGDSYGYRLERDGKAVVYTTDSEHKLDGRGEIERVVAFFRDADLVVFDAMYSLADTMSVKEDWGHSSNVVGLELCQLARARHLVLFHHEPVFDDHQIHQIFQETVRLEEITRRDHPVRISAAYDGLVIDV
ncbi:MAG TPA: MBL fold metallo-hydrolase [Candidatus Sulfotelmatobacter sp.]|nr:MBL fold metallo-hydrolase [Candidatus Sulfotelmatobacter sp.]